MCVCVSVSVCECACVCLIFRETFSRLSLSLYCPSCCNKHSMKLECYDYRKFHIQEHIIIIISDMIHFQFSFNSACTCHIHVIV